MGAAFGYGREKVNAFRLERGGEIQEKVHNAFQLNAWRGVQFIARDGRADSDVPQRHFDGELGKGRLDKPRIGLAFFFRLGRSGRL